MTSEQSQLTTAGEGQSLEPQPRRRGGKHRPATPPPIDEFADLVGALADTWADRLWEAGRDDLSTDLSDLARRARAAACGAVA